MNRILLLIDVSNLYYCVGKKFPGLRLDYRQLIKLVEKKGTIVRAIAYGSQMNGQAESFIGFLNTMGIETKFKEPLVYQNADGNENRKADWDVGIAMDAVRMLDIYDTLVLASADGDMSELIRWVQERGRRTIVIGTRINRLLRDIAGENIEISHDMVEPLPC